MKNFFSEFWEVVYGPKLYTMTTPKLKYYEQNYTELVGEKIINTTILIKIAIKYTCPIFFVMMLRNHSLMWSHTNLQIYTKILFTVIFVFGIGQFLKGFGRLRNQDYLTFYAQYRQIMISYRKNMSSPQHKKTLKHFLRQYDFDLGSWPPNMLVSECPDLKILNCMSSNVNDKDFSLTNVLLNANNRQLSKTNSNMETDEFNIVMNQFKRYAFNILSFLATHSFGLSMAYPGATKLMNYLMSDNLIDGRFRLLTRAHGIRAKLSIYDGNMVDTMFIDKRNVTNHPETIQNIKKPLTFNITDETLKVDYLSNKADNSIDAKGEYLIITCEGNASYYEFGSMNLFIGTGYSVLGWNHPGFAASTGKPYPLTDVAFMDAVMQYAITELGFPSTHIIIYAWSIGCYPATWAASKYPNLLGIILDAAFDDILPLAVNRMPSLIESLVLYTVRRYLDLRTVQYLIGNQNNKIIFVRRTEDEIMNIGDGLLSNPINNLILSVYSNKYPNIFTPENNGYLRNLLSQPLNTIDDAVFVSPNFQDIIKPKTELVIQQTHHNGSDNANENNETTNENNEIKTANTPTLLEALSIIKQHVYDFDGTHCEPLPKYLLLDLTTKLINAKKE